MPTARQAKQAVPTSTSALTATQVKDLMLTKLSASGLQDHVTALRVKPLTATQVQADKHPAFAGFRIPYLDPRTGKETGFYRLRYLEDTRTSWQRLSGEKPMRYIQPGRTLNEVYFAPKSLLAAEWRDLLGTADAPLLITEGELKAACACLHGLPTLGLGGVWCFKSTKAGAHLLPQLQEIEWVGRTVYICYDSDAATNTDVLAAESALAHQLTQCGALVYIARLPPLSDGRKCGLDDWLMARAEVGSHSPGEDLQARVLAHAYPYTEASALHEMNTQVVYVANPGFVYDRARALKMRPSDFTAHQYANRFYYQTVTGANGAQSLKKVSTASAWIQWAHRAELEKLEFSPGEPEITERGTLNTWTGWTVEPQKGDVGPWLELMEHLFADDLEERRWFERWCAYPLQHPGAKMATAALIWGITHGSGKTMVGHTLMRIYGEHAVEIHDTDLEDDRNEWAADRQFVLCDDIVAKGDRKLMRRLMTLITQQWIRLNPKFIPSYSITAHDNYYYTANEPDTFYMDDGDRRFFIYETRAGKFANYKEYVRWRESPEGIAALFHYLLHLPMGDFDPQAPAPETDAKREMIETGKSDLGGWVREFKVNTDAIMTRYGFKGDLMNVRELMAMYDPTGAKGVTANALARELRRAGFILPGKGHQVMDANGVMVRVYAVRNLDDWAKAERKQITEHYRQYRPKLADKKGPKF